MQLRLGKIPNEPSINITMSTAELWTSPWNLTISGRALGFDTNYIKNIHPGPWCGNMSKKTFTHTGYTGVQFCADPEIDVITVMLTNRVYPTEENVKNILRVRDEFNTAVAEAVRRKPSDDFDED